MNKRKIDADADFGEEVSGDRKRLAEIRADDLVPIIKERLIRQLSAKPVFTTDVRYIGFKFRSLVISDSHGESYIDRSHSRTLSSIYIDQTIGSAHYSAYLTLSSYGEELTLSTMSRLWFKKVAPLSILESFDRFVNLEQLEFENCANLGVPSEISRLSSLRILSFENCERIQSLQWCSSLTRLQAFTARREILEDTSFVSNMTALRDLTFAECKIEHLSENLSALTQLSQLVLFRTPITTFSWRICVSCTNLKSLCLTGCNLRTLPPEISRLLECNLTSLFINFNNFATLPLQLFQLQRNLTTFNTFGVNISTETDWSKHVITHWPECTFMYRIPRELQLVIFSYVAPPRGVLSKKSE